MKGIVLQSAVISDAPAAYPGATGGKFIIYMLLYVHAAKIQRKNILNKLT